MPPRNPRRRPSLHDELNSLKSERNSYKRGVHFELFLARMLEEDAFKVTRNPRTARPRQTDLAAHDENGFFLTEAKWTKRRTGISDIVQVRDRLARVPTDVFACVFSMSGFSEPAINEICSRRDREIHLFNQVEIRGMVDGRLSFRELLKKKREWLRMHGSPFLLESVPLSVPPFQLRCEPDVFNIGGSLSPWLRIRTGTSDLIFSNELLDFSGRQIHSTFSLELQPRTDSLHDLRRLLNVIQNLFGLSGQGPFSINQGGESWFGYGLDSFLSAAEQQQGRYDELNWQSYHHSEQLAYLDRPETGGLICVTSQQSTGTGRGNLHSTFLEMYLPGVPVDTSHIRELCKIAGDENASLEFVKDNPVFECHLPTTMEVRPVAQIVSNTNGDRFTSGLVVENPFQRSAVSVNDKKLERFLGLVRESEFLLCALRDWHGPLLMDSYRIRSIEACWIERFCAFYLICDW